MSLFGKILVVFNFILAVVVLLVAGMDYGKRQSWRYAALRHEVLIRGLPVNNTEENEKEPGSPLVDDLKPGLLKVIFESVSPTSPSGLAGGPVKTVEEELNRVERAVVANLTTKEAAKAILIPQARTLADREKMIKMVAEDDVSLSASKAEFQRLCAAAKANVGGGPPNFKDLRQNIAQILVNLDFNKDWRQRCIVVLGLPSYIEALSRQADSLNMMSVDLENAIDTDRSTFERHYEALKQSILQESDELYKSVQFLADLKATSAERQMAVNVRTAERDEEKNKLKQAKEENYKADKKLKEIQADLFALQQKMGQALQRNDQLEGELRKLEQKR